MQLFTLGLTQLNPDGTPVLDQNKNPDPHLRSDGGDQHGQGSHWLDLSYRAGRQAEEQQSGIFLSARCLPWKPSTTPARRRFSATSPSRPDRRPSRIWIRLLDALMAQPTMAPFVSQQLIQHLVTSNPSPAYIARVSSVFQNDGNGVTGNLQAVIAAILTDPEARAGDDPTDRVGQRRRSATCASPSCSCPICCAA